MKQKWSLVLFLLGWAVQAQQNTVASGGEASGSGGSASFSVGQIVWHAIPGQNFSVQEGLQQPFEVFVLSAPEHTENFPSITIYPNPVTSKLMLELGSPPEDSHYELYNISGQLIQSQQISSESTPVSMENFQAGVYILQVKKSKKSIRSFKILKN